MREKLRTIVRCLSLILAFVVFTIGYVNDDVKDIALAMFLLTVMILNEIAP